MRLIINQITKTLIRVAGINQQNMCVLLVILAHQMVGEERLART